MWTSLGRENTALSERYPKLTSSHFLPKCSFVNEVAAAEGGRIIGTVVCPTGEMVYNGRSWILLANFLSIFCMKKVTQIPTRFTEKLVTGSFKLCI